MDPAMTALDVNAPTTSRPMLWTGWVLSGLLIAFMALDTVIKLLDLPQVVATMTEMGIPPSLDRLIGAVELVSLLLYIFPRTAILGAILLTGVFGGAVASHLRLLDPLFSHTLFGVYLGLLAWGGLWFRSAKLRQLLPIGA
jgi:hypothetical protein